MQERQVCRSVNPAVHDVEQLSQLWMSDFKLSCTFRSTVCEYNVTSLAPSKIFLGIELDTIAMEARLQQRNFHVYIAQFTLGKAGKAALNESYCL